MSAPAPRRAAPADYPLPDVVFSGATASDVAWVRHHSEASAAPPKPAVEPRGEALHGDPAARCADRACVLARMKKVDPSLAANYRQQSGQ